MEPNPPDPPFKLDRKHAVPFENAVDPFNPQNRVTGWINAVPNFHYGTVYITHVNDEIAVQVIPAAPKQHFPFDTKDRWEFPGQDRIEVYEKLDGTCIIGFGYHDAGWNQFVSYKTRRTPFLNNEGRFGNLVDLWNEMRAKYAVDRLIEYNTYRAWIFELFGTKRHHLIKYDIPLDTRLIFTRKMEPNYQVFEPVEKKDTAATFGIPIVTHLKSISTQDAEQLKREYTQMVDDLESKIIKFEMDVPADEDNPTTIGVLGGKEGAVWYFITDTWASQMKCKPPSVLEYHWSQKGQQAKIPLPSIYTTIVNSFEETAEPTIELINTLLMEDFPEEQVYKAQGTTQRVLDSVKFERKTADEVLGIYTELGVDWATHKGYVMRQVNQRLFKDYPDNRRKFLSKMAFKILERNCNAVGDG